MDDFGSNAPTDESNMSLPKSKVEDEIKLRLSFNIETIRMIGLTFMIIMLPVGKITTDKFVNFPNDLGTIEGTFIYQKFHFAHTCVYIDYQPAKQIAAIIAQGFLYPMVLYVILAYYRAAHDHKSGEISDKLWTYTRIVTPFYIVSIPLFVLCFVNTPDDKTRWFFGLDNAGFWWHYIPFFGYQLTLCLLAVGQVWYTIEKNLIPFGISRKMATAYAITVCCVLIYYTAFIVSYLLDHPILDTTAPRSNTFAQVIMFTYSFLVIFLPIIFANEERKNGNTNLIEFS